MLDYLAFAQNEGSGGWTYTPNYGPYGDNSVSGYVSLGLAYAEAPAPWGFGLTIPGWVLTELNNWINYIQNTSGGTDDGGSGYWDPNSWVNILKTGNLLAQMALVGDTQATPRVQRAVAYIARHWNDANIDPGWRNHYQACFCVMKGFQALGITLIDVDGDTVPETDWYDEMSTMIVTTQNADGSWPSDYWWYPTLSAAWAMLTLEKAAPPALSLTPPFDTNPTGTTHTVTATYKLAGVPQPDVQINFLVTAGPNAGDSGSSTTDVNGEASFTYTGDGGVGTDTIQATAIDEAGAPLVSARVTKEWWAASDLAISKSGIPDPVVPGAVMQYTLTVTNNGPSDATNVVVTDTLPAAAISTITLGAPSQGSASELGGVVTWNVGNLSAGSSAQLPITLTVKSSAAPNTTIVNTAKVTGDQYDPNPTNNETVEKTMILPYRNVPGISSWGIAAMAVLFCGTLTWLVRRKLVTEGRGR
ncbi:MAG: DUF11 domain-containing protein [Chloroflexi bacterium]|nr:DUF11 domain-containing protein [Chloroflexota bacterium]